jgi:phosphatidylethanolamine/phosphatidyl-N-methylethanolamine N-methyltransferase
MRRLATFWNQIRYSIYTPIYDWIAGGFYPQRGRSIAQIRAGNSAKILIVGAGTGLDLNHLRGYSNITAVDITPSMLYLLKKRAKSLNLQLDARVMDGQQLQFGDNSFDVIVLHLILAVIPDPVACIKEAERVAKPGGELVVFDKFLEDGKRASWLRRIVNAPILLLATSINRRMEDLLAHTQLRKTNDEPAGFGGLFRILHLQKP